MKLSELAVSTLGFASLAVAQNGNDPLILNNRTGLAPVVYDTFSTSYTKPINESTRSGSVVTAPVTFSNTLLPKPTTSPQCWRNGYPCGQRGGQRTLRRAVDEEFPAKTSEERMDILPIPTEFLDENYTPVPIPTEFLDDLPSLTDIMDILPIPTEFLDDHYNAPSEQRVPPPEFFSSRTDLPIPGTPAQTGEAIVSTLPIHTPAPTDDPEAIVPSEWLRGPAQSTVSEGDECYRHYYPSNKPRPSRAPTTPVSEHIMTTSHIQEDHSTKLPAVPPQVTTHTVDASATIRGPLHTSVVDIECDGHYCPSGTLSLPSYSPTLSTVEGSSVAMDTAPETSRPAAPPCVA